MVIQSDIMLRGDSWNLAVNELAPIFKTRTRYSIYLLSTAIGIAYDKQIVELEKTETVSADASNYPSVPRTVFNQNNVPFDYLFKTAILSSDCVNLIEKERLRLAFEDEDNKEDLYFTGGEEAGNNEFNKILFLTGFANFGVTKLIENIGNTNLETMENLKEYLNSIVEGNNVEISDMLELKDDDFESLL